MAGLAAAVSRASKIPPTWQFTLDIVSISSFDEV